MSTPGDVHLTTELVQAVRDTIDIVDIAGDLTRLQKRGKRYLGLCPFHREKTPSFSVDPAQGLFYCFGCGAGGDAIELYKRQTGDDFPAAIEALAQRYGIPLPAARPGAKKRADVTPALEAAASFFARQLESSDFARSYLDRRLISPELRRTYGLGYAPDGWENLLRALRERFSLELLISAGLVGRSEKTGKPYDRFRHRLMFPISSPAGRLVGFGGRTLGDDRAKYVNTAETERFHKGNLLYGFHQAKREMRDRGQAFLVEGYFDVLGAVASGIDWSVAVMGTALTAEQAKLLARYVDEVVLGYDGDQAGEAASARALPILLAAGLRVRRARLGAGHDPDSLRLEAGPEAVRQAVEDAPDAVAREIDRLAPPGRTLDPQATSRAASAVAEILRPIRDNIVRHGYGRRAAERLAIPLEMLWQRAAGRTEERSDDTVRRRREVRSAEEKALSLLLRQDHALPPADQLPSPDVFFDPEWRNIYAAFCALYKSGSVPDGRDVVSKLQSKGLAIDPVAGLLLEESDSGDGELREILDHLLHRWRKRRRAELDRQFRQAAEQRDETRIAQLMEERARLIRDLHPGVSGKL